MKKKIAILTATRAEYGLLSPLIHGLIDTDRYDIRVAVTGAHLSREFGMTYKEIEQDNVPIDKKIEILLNSDTPVAISKSMGLAMISFGEYFEELAPDALIVLGDRYETLAVCCAAMNARIPIFHLYGGEVTEGAIDEAIRHSISKMSYLHFTSTEDYRKRVIQLGEEPNRVFNVGSLGIENASKVPLLSKKELAESVELSLEQQYAVVTFHPVTLEQGQAQKEVWELLHALDEIKDMQFIITKANADAEGRVINSILDQYVQGRSNVRCFDSLGMRRYLSALNYAEMVIGNSSSGLLEAPYFHIPTINIGDRQRGRKQSESVINCAPKKDEILKAIEKGRTEDFKNAIQNIHNPYGDGNTSKRIIDIINDMFEKDAIDIKKKFYNVDFTV